jgi:sucrose phosphorylase
MIIVGAYPRSIVDTSKILSPLSQLHDLVTDIPQQIALHILPFCCADGDHGFASRDWLSVEPALGTWEDVKKLIRQRRVVVDGIYNHVGLEHAWIKEWRNTGRGKDRLHVFSSLPKQQVLSPRGGSVFHPHEANGHTWWAWQTFSENAIDIQLGNSEIMAAINQHLAMLKDLHIWGVRLDSVAYYGKQLGGCQTHNSLSIRYAREIAAIARKYEIHIIPQLNCDSLGQKYFPISVPLTDFAYSALLALAILSGNPRHLISHICQLLSMGVFALRSMRTHDGILLKTSVLQPSQRYELVAAFSRHDIRPRIIENYPYEFNCSFPYVCSLGVDNEMMWRRIGLSIAITAFLPGICYIYLPTIYGFRPEYDAFKVMSKDPRSLNRAPMPKDFVMNVHSLINYKGILEILNIFTSITEDFDLDRHYPDDSIELVESSGVLIKRACGHLSLVVNFDTEQSISLPSNTGQKLINFGVENGKLAPLGFGLWAQ